MLRTNRQGGEVITAMVKLVRETYSETVPAGDGRGLARFEELLYRRSVTATPRRWGLSLALVTLSAVAVVEGGTRAYRHFEQLTYEVMNGAIGPGGLVRSTAPGTAILFSEGSELLLAQSAQARVDNLTSAGGRLVVENGNVHARIVPRKGARWSVEAGPYTIRVTGTAFDVHWSWTDERLDVHMDRGSVVVTGPLAPSGVTLTAGMHLVANPHSGLAIAGRTEDAPAAIAPAPASTNEGGPAAGERTPLAPRQRSGGGPRVSQERRPVAVAMMPIAGRAAEGWDQQLARGDVQVILDDAEVRGVDRVLSGASERDLVALADAARYGHRPVLARRALLSVRARFPQSASGHDAAFFLGSLAEDASGAGGAASSLEWYDDYLRESGQGRYAAQALGRKMVMTQRLKGLDEARPVAREYLDRFPGGAYASAARKLMRTP